MSSSSSPLLFVQHANEKMIDVTSPTSTVEIHDPIMEVNYDLNQRSSVDRLTSLVSGISCSPCPHFSTAKKNKISLKTVHNSEIKILKPFHMVLDLKVQLCRDSLVNIADLMIIKNGKELSNCDSLTSEDLKCSKVFVMVKTTAKTVIPITMKTQGLDGTQLKTLKLPLNIKVGQLKKQLFSSKITSLKPESQRIILGGKVLQDCFIIGDYLLYAMLSKPVVSSSSSSSSSSVQSPTVPSSSSTSSTVQPMATLYLSKTTNLKHEVAITFVSGVKGNRELKCDLEISKPISMFNTILHRQFHQPLPNDKLEYVFLLRVPKVKSTTLASTTANTMSKKGTLSYTMIELDQSKTLLDYGLDTTTKAITVEIARRDLTNPLRDFDPLQITLFMHNMIALYSYAARLKCEAVGIDLTAPPVVMQNTVTTKGQSILSLMTATNALAPANKISSDSEDMEEEGSRSPNSVVNSKKRTTSRELSPKRAVSPKRSATAVATHVSTSEKTPTAVPKKASGGLFGGLKKGFLSKK